MLRSTENGIVLEKSECLHGEIHCSICDGTGYIKLGKEYKDCKNCRDGKIHLCSTCGKPYSIYCNDSECINKRAKIKEAEEFKMAKKLRVAEVAEEYTRMFYSEHCYRNNGYFDDLEEFISELKEEKREIPEYVWATYEDSLSISADQIVEEYCEEIHEDALDSIGSEDIKELQEFLDTWCKKQTGTLTYTQNKEIAIILERK